MWSCRTVERDSITSLNLWSPLLIPAHHKSFTGLYTLVDTRVEVQPTRLVNTYPTHSISLFFVDICAPYTLHASTIFLMLVVSCDLHVFPAVGYAQNLAKKKKGLERRSHLEVIPWTSPVRWQWVLQISQLGNLTRKLVVTRSLWTFFFRSCGKGPRILPQIIQTVCICWNFVIAQHCPSCCSLVGYTHKQDRTRKEEEDGPAATTSPSPWITSYKYISWFSFVTHLSIFGTISILWNKITPLTL
jgi:hypothetical protein